MFTIGTQLLKSGRQVVIHFPADADAEQFMQLVEQLESGVPMVVRAAMQKPKARAPESVWTLILERCRVRHGR